MGREAICHCVLLLSICLMACSSEEECSLVPAEWQSDSTSEFPQGVVDRIRRPRVGVVDRNFAMHPHIVSMWHFPAYFVWDRDTPASREIVVFTDFFFADAAKRKFNNAYRVAWGLEVLAMKDVKFLRENSDRFDLILHHNNSSDFQDVPNAKPFLYGVSWLLPNSWAIYRKSKMLSIVASKKTWYPGHLLRHRVIAELNRRNVQFEAFGAFVNRTVEYKVATVKDFRYQIVIENRRTDYYFTEKIMDCFAAGTIPIYWGSFRIADVFDPRGIIVVNSFEEIMQAVSKLSASDYSARMPAIQRNFEIAMELRSPEDLIWKMYLEEVYNKRHASHHPRS